jgi:hypothetical protein
MGVPKPEPGPVSDKLTPILISASAAVLVTAVMAKASRVFFSFMLVS